MSTKHECIREILNNKLQRNRPFICLNYRTNIMPNKSPSEIHYLCESNYKNKEGIRASCGVHISVKYTIVQIKLLCLLLFYFNTLHLQFINLLV